MDILYLLQHCIIMSTNTDEIQLSFSQKYGLQYYAFIGMFAAFIALIELTEKPALAVAFYYIIHYLGRFLPKDEGNTAQRQSRYHNEHFYHLIPLYLNIFATWGMIAYAWSRYPILANSTSNIIFSTQAFGLLFGASLNAAHELLHKKGFMSKAVAYMNMSVFLFSVYPIEHVYSHHKLVGTSKDPITSRKNMNLYFYILRVIYTAHKFTFQYSKLAFTGCMALNAGYIGSLYYFAMREFDDPTLAWTKVGFILLIGVTGFIILETVEYIEHYGLIYNQNQNKQKIRQLSSWNSQHDLIFNLFSFRFQRHSDHHVNSVKYYSTLELTPDMPHFPFSFLEGTVLALIPPLWFYLMNPYVDQQIEQKPVEKTHGQILKVVKEVAFIGLITFLVLKSF